MTAVIPLSAHAQQEEEEDKQPRAQLWLTTPRGSTDAVFDTLSQVHTTHWQHHLCNNAQFVQANTLSRSLLLHMTRQVMKHHLTAPQIAVDLLSDPKCLLSEHHAFTLGSALFLTLYSVLVHDYCMLHTHSLLIRRSQEQLGEPFWVLFIYVYKPSTLKA